MGKSKSIGTLGVIAIAVGVGVFGYFMLDVHGHICEACGNKWRHVGAFNFGDQGAHTCGRCGVVQWFKDGFQQAFRDPSRPVSTYTPPTPPPQESRAAPPAGLPSGVPVGWDLALRKEKWR